MKVVGIKTASNTSTTPTIGPTISPIASVTASRAVYFPVSISRDEFSTTTIASSTTIAMARINPNKVNVLIENPKADMTASVPIRETGMVMQGMITALCALFLQANKEPKFFVFKAFNKVFGKTQKIYDDIVGRMLKNPFVTMVKIGRASCRERV